MMTKRIAITGASGFIGQQLVPLLEAKGHELVLIGRDLQKLQSIFPNATIQNYDELEKSLSHCDIVVHLAALVRDSSAEYDAFVHANVLLTKQVLTAAQKAGVKVLVNLETFGGYAGHYSTTKEMARSVLNEQSLVAVFSLRVPAVYGDRFNGKLGFLNQLPRAFKNVVFLVLASARCTVNVVHIADEIDKNLDLTENISVTLTDQQVANWFYHLVRRVIDLCFALGILIVFWWLLIGIWVAVRLTSQGPGIFAQKRVGRFGKIFTLYKFRTMIKNTKHAGSHEVSSASLTKIGSMLRKTKIDELPQIWNILRGEISLIGPRPCLPVQEELVAARTARNVLDILPGITGYAQVKGIDMSNPQLLAKTDEEYMKLRTLPLDFKILIETFLGRGNGDRIKG